MEMHNDDMYRDKILQWLSKNVTEIRDPETLAKNAGLDIAKEKAHFLCNKMSRDGFIKKSEKNDNFWVMYEGLEFISDGGYTELRERKKQESEKQNNLVKSGIISNRWSPRFAGLAALMAVAAACISFLDYKKSNEKLQPVLERIEEGQKRQVQEMQRIAYYLEALNSSIQNKDSLK